MKPAKPRVKVYKPTRFDEGLQPGTVKEELNQRRVRMEERESELQLARLQATRHEREREPHSIWWSFFRIFRRFWPRD